MIMKEYYIFNLKKEFVKLYKDRPSELFYIFNRIYYMKEVDKNYGYNLFEQICNFIDKKEVNEFLKKYNSSELTTGASLADLVKRTELTYEGLKEIDPNRPELAEQVEKEVGIELKYEGYIKLQAEQVEKFKKLEQKLLPEDINYEDIKGLRLEARQKLNKIRPNSVGQASRISGVSPADISVLLIYLETYNKVK